MSGPSRDQQLYESYSGSLDWDKHKANELRELADRVDDGLLFRGEDADLPNDEIAALLRAKADRIEAALQVIQNETHGDYNDLVKAIQYYFSGDYGPESIREAWDSYGEKND